MANLFSYLHLFEQQTSEGSSQWLIIEMVSSKAGVPQFSILGLLLFLVCINDLSRGLRSNAKLFADNTSLVSKIISAAISSSNLNEDLLKITQQTYQWKMLFNPDITKEAQEIFFSQKENNTSHPSLILIMHEYNENLFKNIKYLGLISDEKLSFFFVFLLFFLKLLLLM